MAEEEGDVEIHFNVDEVREIIANVCSSSGMAILANLYNLLFGY